jgi:hypothetical protein
LFFALLPRIVLTHARNRNNNNKQTFFTRRETRKEAGGKSETFFETLNNNTILFRVSENFQKSPTKRTCNATKSAARARHGVWLEDLRRKKKRRRQRERERDQKRFFFSSFAAHTRSGAFKIERENVPKRRLSSHLGVCVR